MLPQVNIECRGAQQHLDSCFGAAHQHVLRSAHDCEALFKGRFTGVILTQEGAPVFLAGGRMMRIRAAPVLPVQRTGLPEQEAEILFLLNHQAQISNEGNVLWQDGDVRMQHAAAAKTACPAQRRTIRPAAERLVNLVRHGPNGIVQR